MHPLAKIYLKTCQDAETADMQYQMALKKQFGPKANRWNYPNKSIYTPETFSAFIAKVSADQAMRLSLDNMRAASVTVHQ